MHFDLFIENGCAQLICTLKHVKHCLWDEGKWSHLPSRLPCTGWMGRTLADVVDSELTVWSYLALKGLMWFHSPLQSVPLAIILLKASTFVENTISPYNTHDTGSLVGKGTGEYRSSKRYQESVVLANQERSFGLGVRSHIGTVMPDRPVVWVWNITEK